MSLESLQQTMTKMIAIHETLLDLAEEKKNALIANEIERLNRIVNKESSLIRQASECEKMRIQAVGGYLISKGFNPNPNIKISELIKLVFNAEDKKALLDSQQKLVKTIGELKKRNEINQQLIEQSLLYVNYSIDLVVAPPVDDIIYQNPMQQGYGVKRQGIFDSKV